MAWSGLLVLVVKCVSTFSIPGGGFILLLFILFFTIVAGFGIHCLSQWSATVVTRWPLSCTIDIGEATALDIV